MWSKGLWARRKIGVTEQMYYRWKQEYESFPVVEIWLFTLRRKCLSSRK